MANRSIESREPATAEGARRWPRLGLAARQASFWPCLALAFLLITGTMLEARVIPTRSMEQTLLAGDHLLISRFGYDASIPFSRFHWRLWREPRRSQLILFRAPIPGPEQGFIERVIGMPGDTIEIRRGVVYVNDSALAEPYRSEPPAPNDHYGPVTVPAESYFFLGDNRNVSFDSRHWGFVLRRQHRGPRGRNLHVHRRALRCLAAWRTPRPPHRVSERAPASAPGPLAPPLHAALGFASKLISCKRIENRVADAWRVFLQEFAGE